MVVNPYSRARRADLRSQDGAVRQRPLENLLVVLARLLIALQKNMRVRIHQAGQTGLCRKVDESRAGWLGKVRRVIRDGAELASRNLHQHVLARLIRYLVNQRAAVNKGDLVTLSGLAARRRRAIVAP